MANANGTLKFLKENWFIIAVVSSLIGSWATLNNKASNNEKNIAKITSSFDDCRDEVLGLKKDIYHLTDIMARNEKLLNDLAKEVRER